MKFSTRVPTIYLVGPIRDHRTEDIAWRAQVIEALSGKACILSPLGGKTYSESAGWRMSGIPSTAPSVVKHDFWSVDHADIVLANMLALAEGYPCVGSLIELGRATATGALIYLIVSPEYRGHGNANMYTLHPFLDQISAARFASVGDALAFLSRHLDVLSGRAPHFDGVVA